jgi:hypothetical protein
MLKDIIEVKPLDDYRLRLRFEDGTEGTIDLTKLVPFTGVFAALRDRNNFNLVRVDPELGAVCWPNGADLDPDVLYSIVTGKAMPSYREKAQIE